MSRDKKMQSTVRVDPQAFRAALARAIERREQRKRALAQQLADSVARRGPAGDAVLPKRAGRGDLTKELQVRKRRR